MQAIMNNRYRIDEIIGTGATGQVYAAYDLWDQEDVALKYVLKMEQGQLPSPSFKRNLDFAREFQLVATLRDPHVVDVVDFGFDEQQSPFFTMTLLRDAQDIITASKNKSDAQKVKLLIQLLEGVEYLHHRNILHRDLKPTNVLVDRQGVVKILDFGLAVEDVRIRQTVGTVQYMAPEILMGQATTYAADLYSVGVIAYEMFIGKLPFDHPEVTSLAIQIINTEPDLGPAMDKAWLLMLLARLLEKDPGLRPLSAREAIGDLAAVLEDTPPPDSLVVHESSLRAAKFTGRSEETQRLEAAIDRAMEGKGSLWLIGGESGAGKSRLVNEIRPRALVKGMQVLTGTRHHENNLPYAIWHYILRKLVMFTEVSDLELSVISEMVPDVAQRLGRPVTRLPGLDARSTRQRTNMTIVDLFRRQQKPLFVVLDDIQSGSEYLEPIQSLSAYLDELPIILICTYQSDDFPDLPDQFVHANTIELAPLNEADIASLCKSMLGDMTQMPEIISFVQRESHGNALFLIESIRALIEESGAKNSALVPETLLAGGMQGLQRRRLSQVPDWGRNLLHLAALEGYHLNLGVLEILAASYLEGYTLQHWVSVCGNAAVISYSENGWTFSNPQIRQQLRDDMPPAQHVPFRAAIAQALEHLYGKDSLYAVTIAEHWLAAGAVARAIPHILVFGEQCLERNTRRDSASAMALNALGGIPEGQSNERLLLLKLVGDIAKEVDDLDTAAEYYSQSLDMAHSLNAPLVLIEILNAYSAICWKQGDLAKAEELAREALTDAEQHAHPAGIATAYNNLGVVCGIRGNLALAKEYMETQIQILRRLNLTKRLGFCLVNLGMIASMLGDDESARAYYRESLDVYKSIVYLKGIGDVLNNLGITYITPTELDVAYQYQIESLSIRQKIKDEVGTAMNLSNLGEISSLQQQYEQSHIYYSKALDYSRPIGNNLNVAQIQGDRAANLCYLNRMDEARLALLEALGIAKEADVPPITGLLMIQTAKYLVFQSYPVSAAELLGMLEQYPDAVQEPPKLAVVREKLDQMLTPQQIEAAFQRGSTFNLSATLQQMYERLSLPSPERMPDTLVRDES
jgi:tetratricopeptide (TPR) repeat protein